MLVAGNPGAACSAPLSRGARAGGGGGVGRGQLGELTRNRARGRRKRRGWPGNLKGSTGFAPPWSSTGTARTLLGPCSSWAAGPSMADDAGAAEAQGDQCTPAQSLGRLLKLPLPPPRIRTRPWWFPVQELRDPLVFYLEAWLADSIFGEPP